MFISFDGVDGAGKSTQIGLFCDWLRESGLDVVTCRDPGSTPLGESLRSVVLGATGVPIHRRAEMLLYMAARAQLVEDVIRPALLAGKCVVSDRYLLANVVYQGYAGGLNVDDVWTVGAITVGGLMPDLTFILDIDPERSLSRLDRTADRMEAEGVEFLRRVRSGFLTEAAKRPGQIFVVDAQRGIEPIQADLRRLAEPAVGARIAARAIR
jgi:dTMP kinase